MELIKHRVVDYWTRRAEGFEAQRLREFESEKRGRWLAEMRRYLPEGEALRGLISDHNRISFELYEKLLAAGVCREQARGVLPQNMMVTFWGTVDLSNLIHFLELRDSPHAQWEIREYARSIKTLIEPVVPNVAAYFRRKGQW